MLSIKFGFTAFGFSSDYNDEHAVIKFMVNIREMVSVMFIIFMSGQGEGSICYSELFVIVFNA